MLSIYRLKKLAQLMLLGLFITNSSNVFGWGQTGHRVSGEIAETYLSAKSKRQIKKLYPDESLAEISTLMDQMRSHPSKFWQKTANPWHYVTVPEGSEYHLDHAPSEGDAFTALQTYTATLKDPKASVEDKRTALLIIVHLIGDLHQPFHAGNGNDRGGNDVKVEFFWEKSNLHRVWDSGMIDRQQLSYTEWTTWLSQKMTPNMVDEWRTADPAVWIKESAELRDGLYPENDKISWQYQYEHLPAVKTRLQMAGVRIAVYLNEVFK
ncbi:MAG: hypothetical protein ACJAXW_003045 [Candidatus Azotimanducaceae bacterium]